MVAARNQCDAQRLAKLLSDELPELEEARATDHVSQCPTCRTRIQEMAAASPWWQETSEHLHGSRWNVDGTLGLTARGFEKTGADTSEDCVTSLDFLEPSDNPAMLGRMGAFEILSVLGSGGFGIVLKGYDHELNRYVAVKVLAPHLAHNAAARKRFAREAQAAAAVVHPHVVAIHTVDPSGKLPFLVMPLIAGESLQDRLNRAGPLEIKEVLRIGLQVAQGLAAAHAQGVVHRDVKPANILLERGVDRVMLTDFGLARAMDDASLTRSTVIAGTPQYMSPEQAHGNSVDHRTDLFSLGSVLYAMCTGNPPFRAETLMGILRRITDGAPRDVREVNSDVPEWLADVIARLHAKSADERLQSAGELAELLERGLAHLQQPTQVPRPMVPGSRRPVVAQVTKSRAAVAGMVLLTIIGLATSPLWLPGPADDSQTPNAASQPASPLSKPDSLQPEPTRAPVVDWNDDLDRELQQINYDMQWLEWTTYER